MIGPSMQEILDQAAQHLFKQGERCFGPTYTYVPDRCSSYPLNDRYRWGRVGEQELSDPVGVFIPDKLYDPEIEGQRITDIVSSPLIKHLPTWMVAASGDKRCHRIQLLQELQDAHDCPANWEDGKSVGVGEKMREALKAIAKKHKLKVDVINQLKGKKKK